MLNLGPSLRGGGWSQLLDKMQSRSLTGLGFCNTVIEGRSFKTEGLYLERGLVGGASKGFELILHVCIAIMSQQSLANTSE